MSEVLNERERNALNKLCFDHRDFLVIGQLSGIGSRTLDRLTSLGLAEIGPSRRHYGKQGWRITPDGWRCMFGKTYEEIMAPGAGQSHPLKVWRWPTD